MERHVVVIYPHPDDESFGAAGTIRKFREQGVPVTFLCGTLGEMGRNMGSPIFANRETLPALREKELAEACRILDIDFKLLGYRDKTMEYEDRTEMAEHIKGMLEAIDPSLVITHYPDYAVHPDHNALGAASIEAVRMMDADKRPTVWAQAISRDFEDVLGKPDICNDITGDFDKKMRAISAHESQASGIIKAFNTDTQEAKDLKEAAMARLGKERYYIWNFNKK
jgi:bacillithiol biosynthesis deacetylase BshB2